MSRISVFWTGCFLGQAFAYFCAGLWLIATASLIMASAYLGFGMLAARTQEEKA